MQNDIRDPSESQPLIRHALAGALLAIGILLSGCDTGPKDTSKLENAGAADTENSAAGQNTEAAVQAVNTDKEEPKEAPIVNVKMTTNMGVIELALDREKAPLSVANFEKYVRDGHYDGTIFHRVINDFMIQGGGFDGSFQQKKTNPTIQNEADNGLKNERGTIAMARTGEPHSATAQFFINVKDNEFLNHRDKSPAGWGYTVFGKVTAGMDVVDKIKELPTGPNGPFRSDVPKEAVVIESATIIE